MAQNEKYHVKTLRGLEPLLAKELASLGAEGVEVVNRGVNFQGGRALLYRVNIASRLALRVLVPVLQFEAAETDTLYRKVKRYDWSRHLHNRMTFAVDAVVHSPFFNNSHFVSLKVKDAIVDQFRERTHLRPSVEKERPDLMINVHISDRSVTLSLDSSGGSLHRRGYRTGTFEAPLNEVLAAGMILSTGWDGGTPFLDPMCGSGTLAIEAALIASGIAPGIFRKNYGFETWLDFDADLMEHVIRQLPEEKEVKVPIRAMDMDPGAVALTRKQLKAMELDRVVSVSQGDFAGANPEGEGITLVMNPPYGERMKHEDLGALYSMIGTTLKHRFPGCDAWILSSSREALSKIGLKPSSKRILYNGSLECLYVNYKTFSGKWKAHKSGQAEDNN
jgi:putative N6-adenine-specific DNA methylase